MPKVPPQTPEFSPFVPTGTGLPENLVPHPPPPMPDVPEVGDALEALSPFSEPLDDAQIIKNLRLDRPLSLYIPNRERYLDHDFRVINDTITEFADAANKGWNIATNPDLKDSFEGKTSGVDKTGKITKPVLMSRSKRITEIVEERNRQKLHDQYQAMDPRNKQFNSKYTDTEAVINSGTTKGQFTGAGWKIRVKK